MLRLAELSVGASDDFGGVGVLIAQNQRGHRFRPARPSTPTTQLALTSGWRLSAASRSSGYMFNPAAVTITSFCGL